MAKRLIHFDIGLELEVEGTVDEAEVKDIIEAALKHSTAAEAVQDAIAMKFDEEVSFLGWWLKGD